MLYTINRLFVLIEKILKWFLIITLTSIVIIIVFKTSEPFIIESKIMPGMSRNELINLVGRNPNYESVKPDFCQFSDCSSLIHSGSSKYLIWMYGIDTTLIVGLDKYSKVIFYSVGDT